MGAGTAQEPSLLVTPLDTVVRALTWLPFGLGFGYQPLKSLCTFPFHWPAWHATSSQRIATGRPGPRGDTIGKSILLGSLTLCLGKRSSRSSGCGCCCCCAWSLAASCVEGGRSEGTQEQLRHWVSSPSRSTMLEWGPDRGQEEGRGAVSTACPVPVASSEPPPSLLGKPGRPRGPSRCHGSPVRRRDHRPRYIQEECAVWGPPWPSPPGHSISSP